MSDLVRSSGCCLLCRQGSCHLLATVCSPKPAQHGRIKTCMSDLTMQWYPPVCILGPRAVPCPVFQEDLVSNLQAERVINGEQSCVCPSLTLRMSLMTCIYVARQLPIGHSACLLPSCQILKLCRWTESREARGSKMLQRQPAPVILLTSACLLCLVSERTAVESQQCHSSCHCRPCHQHHHRQCHLRHRLYTQSNILSSCPYVV